MESVGSRGAIIRHNQSADQSYTMDWHHPLIPEESEVISPMSQHHVNSPTSSQHTPSNQGIPQLDHPPPIGGAQHSDNYQASN